MFFDHPILGVGIGNYPDAYPQYYITIFVNSLGHAHNYYINIAAETGFIGLVVYLLFLLAIFVAGGHAYQAINKRYKQAKAQRPKLPAPLGTRNKLLSLISQFGLIAYHPSQEGSNIVSGVQGQPPLPGLCHQTLPQSPRESGVSPFSPSSTFARMEGEQERLNIVGKYTNDRALAIGLLAALVSVAVHNFVDDLYVHSLTNLIALLLIALIRLERVTFRESGHGE